MREKKTKTYLAIKPDIQDAALSLLRQQPDVAEILLRAALERLQETRRPCSSCDTMFYSLDGEDKCEEHREVLSTPATTSDWQDWICRDAARKEYFGTWIDEKATFTEEQVASAMKCPTCNGRGRVDQFGLGMFSDCPDCKKRPKSMVSLGRRSGKTNAAYTAVTGRNLQEDIERIREGEPKTAKVVELVPKKCALSTFRLVSANREDVAIMFYDRKAEDVVVGETDFHLSYIIPAGGAEASGGLMAEDCYAFCNAMSYAITKLGSTEPPEIEVTGSILEQTDGLFTNRRVGRG